MYYSTTYHFTGSASLSTHAHAHTYGPTFTLSYTKPHHTQRVRYTDYTRIHTHHYTIFRTTPKISQTSSCTALHYSLPYHIHGTNIDKNADADTHARPLMVDSYVRARAHTHTHTHARMHTYIHKSTFLHQQGSVPHGLPCNQGAVESRQGQATKHRSGMLVCRMLERGRGLHASAAVASDTRGEYRHLQTPLFRTNEFLSLLHKTR